MPDHPLLGRRVALTSLLGMTALLAGCRSGGPEVPSGASSSPPASAPATVPPSGQSSSSAPLESGDRTRVRLALEKSDAMLAGVLALRRTTATAALAELHTAHGRALRTMLGEVQPPPAAGLPLTRAELPLREAGLQAELVSAALAAEDGAVARVLASMSAGIAQLLAALPVPRPPRPADSPDGALA